MVRAPRDANRVPTLIGVSSGGFEVPVTVAVDPITHRLLVSATGSLALAPSKYAIQLDDYTTTDVTYIGFADPGSVTSDPVWQICKLDETNGLVMTWADGDSNFDNIWDSRSSLTYN